MQTAAILWHVSLLVSPSRRGLALGLVGLVRLSPVVFFSLLSGMVADAGDRRKMMLVTQSGLAVVAGCLALLTWHGLAVPWPVYALAAFGAAVGAFDGPARQALIPNLVPRETLPNAISLNTIVSQTASVAGPALGGLVIAGLGIGWAYAINALSFLGVILSLFLMRDVQSRSTERGEVSLRALAEGFRFVFRSPLIRSTMLLDAFATFFSSATALLPIFAQDVLRVDAHGYGWLYAAPAVGAVLTSAAMVRLVDRIERRGLVLLVAVGGYALATLAFGLSRSFWLSFFCLAAGGAGDTVSMVFRNVIRQLETPDHLRGRTVGVGMLFFMGGPQLGELEAGLVATWLGPVVAVVSGGIGALVAVAWIGWRTPALRRYRR
jgi:MFS family permease